MPLPQSIRSAVPNGVRDQPALRAMALALGLIPPRTMHSPAEADVLARLAGPAARVVEIGVYEGSSAVVLCRAMAAGAELHLVDPYVDDSGWALPANWSTVPVAARMAVWREARHSGPMTRWHIARSQDVGRSWTGGEVDLVFIDGDHSPEGCREDWDLWHPHVRRGGAVAFHDARLERPGGSGSPGPTGVVDELFRSAAPPAGWSLAEEVDTVVVVRRAAA
ncbi:MAG TPA: class I SAM-dependent methyltransferase [Solirubrobacteraceae bacterium]|nr:class I SAM-dependent methyltransferase [Solirubrobacteraceae bacterium]